MLNPHPPNLNPEVQSALRHGIAWAHTNLASIRGGPVRVEVIPQLSVSRGRLLSGGLHGHPVYAASFLRQRHIVIESEALADLPSFRAILTHELFHFVWFRLGNGRRASYSHLLLQERARGARGDLGESSEVWKMRAATHPTHWKAYVCESFCDTAAYLLTGTPAGCAGKLKERWLAVRRAWFTAASSDGWNC